MVWFILAQVALLICWYSVPAMVAIPAIVIFLPLILAIVYYTFWAAMLMVGMYLVFKNEAKGQ